MKNNLAKEIIQINVERELKNSYLDYAMSVIVGRALPDVRDGLKPVHRRILFAMYILNNLWNKPYKKSARIVGDVIGKYHPHGDSAVYDAIIRMAQQFSLRYTLIDGQGNFGSIDGDAAAAMRYTEVRMSKIAHELLSDLEKKTVDFVPNYDGSEFIPKILPTKIPNLLINGSSGIAVGMATNIPPHNITEVINGCIAYIDNEKMTVQDLIKYIPGPDFPTSGIIIGRSGIEKAYKTGKGKISIRAKHKIETNTKSRKKSIIINEIPYQVNKSRLIEKISELVKEKKIEGISALRDESDKDGMRIVIEIKKEAISEIILNQLYSLSQLQISFGINMVALFNGKPKRLSLLEIIHSFILHRKQTVTRRSMFELQKCEEKIHILNGLSIAIKNINLIIKIIQSSKNSSEAKSKLLSKKWDNKKIENLILNKDNTNLIKEKTNSFFTEKQAQSILELRLSKLTNLEHEKIIDEKNNLLKKTKKLKKILYNHKYMMEIIRNELLDVKKNFGDQRKTNIITSNHSEINLEDMINPKDVVITLSYSGYVKYQPISDYEAQKRGGRGKTAAKTKKTDFIKILLVTNTLDTILCFSNKGILYWMKVYQLPESSRNARGRPIINLLPLQTKERITAILPIKKYQDNINIFMATSHGIVKKTALNEFNRPRNKGIIAINLKNNDELIGIALTNGKDNIMLFSASGKTVQFSETSVRKMGRTASGVKGMKMNKNDRVVSLIVPKKLHSILIVTDKGYGKRTKITDFPIKSRATKGMIAMKQTKKNGIVIAAIQVIDQDQIIIITNSGKLVRTRVSELRILGRNTQGVILIRTSKKEKLVAIQRIKKIF